MASVARCVLYRHQKAFYQSSALSYYAYQNVFLEGFCLFVGLFPLCSLISD